MILGHCGPSNKMNVIFETQSLNHLVLKQIYSLRKDYDYASSMTANALHPNSLASDCIRWTEQYGMRCQDDNTRRSHRFDTPSHDLPIGVIVQTRQEHVITTVTLTHTPFAVTTITVMTDSLRVVKGHKPDGNPAGAARGQLREDNAIWNWLTLVQVVACFLTALSHYVNQCWLIISEALRNSLKGNFTGCAPIIYLWYKFDNHKINMTPAPPGSNELTHWNLKYIPSEILFSNTNEQEQTHYLR